jgi:hypothetical protein
MRTAKPILLVSTPVGVVWGIIEAARFHPGLALLMTVLVSVIAAFLWMTVARIRRERDQFSRAATAASPSSSSSSSSGDAVPPVATAARPAHRR